MKKTLFIAVLLAFPFYVQAAWWNPFTWFQKPVVYVAPVVEPAPVILPVVEPVVEPVVATPTPKVAPKVTKKAVPVKEIPKVASVIEVITPSIDIESLRAKHDAFYKKVSQIVTEKNWIYSYNTATEPLTYMRIYNSLLKNINLLNKYKLSGERPYEILKQMETDIAQHERDITTIEKEKAQKEFDKKADDLYYSINDFLNRYMYDILGNPPRRQMAISLFSDYDKLHGTDYGERIENAILQTQIEKVVASLRERELKR